MINITRSIEWDSVLDAIEESAAAAAMARLLDPALAGWEQNMGLDQASRAAIFGAAALPYRSLLLSYFDLMKKRAREEQAQSPSGYPDAPPIPRAFAPLREKSAGKRIAQTAADLTEKMPKVLPGDRMTPRERIERHIRFDNPDRVGVAPLLGFHTARAGGISVREFMTRGRKSARAARRTWETYGGFDMIPFNFSMGYIFPFVPESHSRFCSNWVLPETGDELPRMLERPLPFDYDDFLRQGCSVVFRTEGGRLLHEFRRMLAQGAAYAAETALNFPRPDLYFPYAAGIINHPADLLSMWLGFERFMMDCIGDPQKIREACERLAPGLAELGAFTARLVGSRQVLYGVSRVSSSWISRKMFDALFADTFLNQVSQVHDQGFKLTYHLDNDYTAMLDFFLELPRHSGIIHFDQTDIFRAKKVLHGHLCLMGNLHPGLLASGSPAEVADQCERLIKEVGAGGGFILAGACEIPVNTPIENLKTLKESVDRFGWY